MTPLSGLANQDDTVPFVSTTRIAGSCFNCQTRFEDRAFTVIIEEYKLRDNVITAVKSKEITTSSYGDNNLKEYKLCYNCICDVLRKCNPINRS